MVTGPKNADNSGKRFSWKTFTSSGDLFNFSLYYYIFFKARSEKKNIVLKYFWNLTTLDKGVLIMDLKI